MPPFAGPLMVFSTMDLLTSNPIMTVRIPTSETYIPGGVAGEVVEAVLDDVCSFSGCLADFQEDVKCGILVLGLYGDMSFEGLDQDGRFWVVNAVPGDYTLMVVSEDESRNFVSNLTIAAGITSNIVFPAGCTSGGEVLAKAGKAVASKNRILLGSVWSDLVDNINAVKEGKAALDRYRAHNIMRRLKPIRRGGTRSGRSLCSIWR